MVLLVWPPADPLWTGRNRGPIRALQPCRSMANARRRTLLVDPGSTRPELRIPNAAAQTRIVSVARIRLDSWKSLRTFKGIICADISEFESYHLSHAVGSLWRVYIQAD